MMEKRAKESRKENMILIGALALWWIFYLYLAAQIPYTHDDWDWGIENGWYQLIHANLNSRYSGNFLEVLLTRSEIFKAFFMGTTFWAIAVGIALFAKKKSQRPVAVLGLFFCANLALLLLRTVIWQQTYGWVAGFANFVASSLWLVGYFLMCRDLFDPKKESKKHSKLIILCEMLWCFTLQLFLENVAVFMVGVGIVFFVGAWIKDKKPSGRYFLHLLSLILGAFIMFSSSMYDTLLSTGQAVDGYRELTFDFSQGIGAIAVSFAKRFVINFLPEIYGHNWGMCLSIGAIMLIYCLSKISGYKRFLAAILHIMITAALVVMYSTSFWTNYFNAEQIIWLPLWFNVLFCILILVEIILCFNKDLTLCFKALGVWLAAPLVIVPLVAVNTAGYRSFLTPYVFLVMFLVLMINNLNFNRQIWQRIIFAILLAANIALTIYWGSIYYDIGQIKDMRDEIIAEAVANNSAEITLPRYPHEQLLWEPDPKSEYRKKYFRLFYELREDTVFYFVDREEMKP